MTGPAGRTDAQLLRAHADGDPDAFGELLARHRDRLWAVALRTMADREEAADALQDALLSAHRAAGRFRGDSAVTTWLHRIVVNSCLDRIRRRRAQPTLPLPEDRSTDETGRRGTGAEPAAPAVDHDTVLVVRAALAELPVEQRTAIVLVDLHGYPVAEAAGMLSVAEGTVKSRCARGRTRLAVLLGHLRGSGHPGEPEPAGTAAADSPQQPTGRHGNQPADPSVPSGSRQVAGGHGGHRLRGQTTSGAVGPATPEGGAQ